MHALILCLFSDSPITNAAIGFALCLLITAFHVVCSFDILQLMLVLALVLFLCISSHYRN